jgi:hypothetical protein
MASPAGRNFHSREEDNINSFGPAFALPLEVFPTSVKSHTVFTHQGYHFIDKDGRLMSAQRPEMSLKFQFEKVPGKQLLLLQRLHFATISHRISLFGFTQFLLERFSCLFVVPQSIQECIGVH